MACADMMAALEPHPIQWQISWPPFEEDKLFMHSSKMLTNDIAELMSVHIPAGLYRGK